MEWISVNNKTPIFNEAVLVYCRLWGIYTAYYEQISDTKYGQWKDFNSIIVLPPTHWMPLPAPPKTD
jgi:hypothetical protein